MNAPLAMANAVRCVDLADDATARRIDGFVAEQRASLFHRPAWLRAVEAGTGQASLGLVSERLGALTGWLPLTQVRSAIFGRALVSSGFGVGGGICAISDDAASELAKAAQRHALDHGFPGIELRGGTVPEGAGWRSYSDRHCGFVAELEADDGAQLKAIPRKARAEVRKGLKNGLSISIGRRPDDLRAHHAAYSQSMRNLGTPMFPRRLFRAMLEAFPESDILTVARDGTPVASVFSFYHDGNAMPFWGGGTHAARAARAGDLMYYELMCHARRLGMQRFDFGRSKTGGGPYSYKKNWGFEPRPLTYFEWTAPGETPRNVDPLSAAYQGRIEAWKKLPLWLANRLGPPIARGLA